MSNIRGPVDVSSINLDVRDLVFATDKVDVSGSSITVTVTGTTVTSLDAATLAALESITVQNPGGASAVNIQDGGNSITVDGTVAISGTVNTDDLTFANDKVDVSGSSVTIEALTFAEDKVDVSGSSVSITGSVVVTGPLTDTQLRATPVPVSGTLALSGTVTTGDDKIEDVPHVSGDTGSFVLAVRNDSNTAFTNTNGDYSPIAVNANGAVAINDGGNSITVDGTVAVSGTVAVTQSTSPWITSLDATTLAALESITVQNPGGASAVNIQDGGNSITVDGTVALDAGTLAALESITVQNGAGAAAVNIQDGGNSITVDGAVTVSGTVTADTNFDYAEDAPHVSGDPGAFVLAVRNDANAVFTNTNGDYSPIAVNSAGAIAINDGGNSITVDGSVGVSGTVAVTQSTSPWVVSGTVTVNQGTSPWVTSLDATTLAALESITVQNPGGASAVNIQDGGNSITIDGTVALDAATLAALESITVQNPGGASAVNIQDGGNSITVDGTVGISGTVAVTQSTSPWVVSGTVTVNQGTSPWVVSGTVATNAERAEDSGHVSGHLGNFVLGVRNDAAAVLTSTDLDYSPFATDSAGRIGISDLGGAISIDDNGGSITVDGTVAVSGTVAVTQSTSPWVVSNPTLSVVGGGTEAAALRVTIANNSTGVLAVTDNGGSLTVDGTVAATQSGAWSVTNLNGAGAAAVNIQDGGNSITVDGTVAATQSGAWTVSNNNGAGAAAVNIQDGGNSITVDGTVAVSGTVAVTQSTTPWVVSQQSGSITNGAETAVSSSAVQILASNAARKKYLIQNTGTANIRVGTTGVTATTGARVVPNGSLLFEMPNCPTQAIFAIREGTVDSIAFAEEIT